MRIKAFFTRSRWLAALAAPLLLTASAFAESITDLSQITDLSAAYELTADIELNGAFVPIGSEAAPFTDVFDGGGHTVKGGGYTALFGYTENAEIRNLHVEDAEVLSAEHFGGIVGRAGGCTVVENCSFRGMLTVCTVGTYAFGGGIAGLVEEEASVSNCFADVSLAVTDAPFLLCVGGVVGKNEGTLSLASAAGRLSAQSGKYRVNLGGIVGENSGTVAGCFNNAAVDGALAVDSAQLFAGGIVGFNRGGKVLRCENLAEIRASGTSVYPAYAGGVIGMNQNGNVDTAKNRASITAFQAFAGGISGMNLGHKAEAWMEDLLNIGGITAKDSVFGGLVGISNATDAEESAAQIVFSLNLSDGAAFGSAQSSDVEAVYSTGAEDGVTERIDADALRAEGLPACLEAHDAAWVSGTDIGALPDMLVVFDLETACLMPSNRGENGDVAYYLYCPGAETGAKSFTAAYYNGNRFLGLSCLDKTPETPFTRLTASNIPDGTTRIKLIAFAEPFASGVKPAPIASVEIACSDN